MDSTCPLCGAPEARQVFGFLRPRSVEATGRHTEDLFGRAGRLVRCSGCGLVRQEDPREAPYEESVDPEYITEEQGIRATFAGILDRIEQHRRPPGRLLDVGCGPGFLLEEARARGWEATGVEPSAWAADEARRRSLDVRQGTLDEADLQARSFEVIVAADVIEHVADPLSFARLVHDLLTPGGVTFMATPNVESLVARVLRRWWWSVIPNHLWFFSPRTLALLLEKSGLQVVESTTHPKTFSVDYYAGRFGGYNTGLGGMTRRVAKFFGGRERLVTPDLRDRLAMIARKS